MYTLFGHPAFCESYYLDKAQAKYTLGSPYLTSGWWIKSTIQFTWCGTKNIPFFKPKFGKPSYKVFTHKQLC